VSREELRKRQENLVETQFWKIFTDLILPDPYRIHENVLSRKVNSLGLKMGNSNDKNTESFRIALPKVR
jgi:hypothetical protein